MTEKGCDNCYYTYFDEKAYPCSLCIRGVKRTDQWQPSKKTKADRKTEHRDCINCESADGCAKCRGFADEPQTHDICTNTHECVKDTHDKTESNSEKPNNCEHITEDGVTCAKYPACDDCLDNPLNKVKGSERLVKGKDEPTISKMEQVDKDINVRSKDEPQTDCPWK